MPLDLSPALSEVFLFIAGLGLLLLGAFRDEEAARILTPLTGLTLVVAALMVLGQDKARIVGLGGHFVFDGYAAFLKVVIFAGAGVAIMMARGYMADQRIDRFEYPILALFSALGMAMMVSANSLLALYMAIELQSLPLYVLAAFNRDSLRSTEAGLKYFVLSSLASGILLYGCSLVYGFTGTLLFDQVAVTLAGNAGQDISVGVLTGLVFIIAGPRLQARGRAVPHVDPRRLRGGAGTHHGLHRLHPQARRHRPCRAGDDGAVRRLDRALAAGDRGDQHRFDGPGLLRRHRPDQHQAPDGL